jgi:hypothetical protein
LGEKIVERERLSCASGSKTVLADTAESLVYLRYVDTLSCICVCVSIYIQNYISEFLWGGLKEEGERK